MLNTKSVEQVLSIADIPSAWIFENYLNLDRCLTGKVIKIKSPLTNEKTASFKVYYNSEWKRYMFKDFSGGHQGDGIRLVSALHNLSREEATTKIINDYNHNVGLLRSYKSDEEVIRQKGYKVTDYISRTWNERDAKFWSQYCIPSSLLEEYCVRPIESFTMAKEDSEEIVIRGLLYGYFKKDGSLYKIYLPGRKTKFIHVQEYLQGNEQLKFEYNTLIIASSLKDMLDIRVLFSNVEVISPDSENSYMSEETMNYYKSKYKTVLVLFDKDDAGQKAAQRYIDDYGINTIYLNLEKDVSDSVKKYGINMVRVCLSAIIRPLLR